MTDEKKSQWTTLLTSALISLAVSLIVTCFSTSYQLEKQHDRKMEEARAIAEAMEERLERDTIRMWTEYRADSMRWEAAWPESLSSAASIRSATGFATTLGAIVRDTSRINSYFRNLISENRRDIEEFEQDESLRIKWLREGGIFLD